MKTSQPPRKSHNPIVYVNFNTSSIQWKLSAVDGLCNYTALNNINKSQYSQENEWQPYIIQKRGESCLVVSALPVPSKMTCTDDLKIAIILNAINLFSSGMELT